MRELQAAATRPRWEKLWERRERRDDSRSDVSGLLDEVEPFPPPEGEAFKTLMTHFIFNVI